MVVVDDDSRTVELPPGATDVALTPYHVECGKLFGRWRFRDHPIIDHEVIKSNIENTRFPVPDEGDPTEVGDYLGLVRVTLLVATVADSNFALKINRLFLQARESGIANQLCYATAAAFFARYPPFFGGSSIP